jgi:hypothetical protein
MSEGPKKRVAKHEKVGKAALASTTNRKKSSGKGKREERAAKRAAKPNPLSGLATVAVCAWVVMGVSFMAWNHGNGTLLPDWINDILNPGTITMNLMEAGDGENTPVKGDEVSIDYTATVTATGKTFDTTQGRGPMTFEVGEEPPKALIGLDLGVQNMTLGETAELQVSSAFAFGSRSVGEGENVVPPNSDITFVVTLVAINDLHMPEPEEEEESYEDNWDDLGDDEQEAATALGWDEDTWGYHTELTQVPFADLTEDQQEAADVLGYDETSWDDPEEFMEEGDEGDEGEDGEE